MRKMFKEIRSDLRKKVMKVFLKYNLPRWTIFTLDSITVYFIFLFAYLVRFNFASAEINLDDAIIHGLIVTSIYAIFSLVFRSYAGILRHTTLTDISILFIVTTLSLTILILISILSRLWEWSTIFTVPISIILIHYVTITVILFFVRVSVKVIFRFATRTKSFTKKVLIYGAGDTGFTVKRVLLSDPRSSFDVAGFVDDNSRLQGLKINGLPVYSSAVLSPKFLLKNKIDTLIIAINTISSLRKSEIIKSAMDAGLDILDTPAVEKWLHGELEVRQLQKVKLEDLLGREPIRLNMELIGIGLNNKTILVSGAAGSIGSEIVRQLVKFDVKDLILVDQAETPMFHLGNEMVAAYPDLKYTLFIADITNKQKMEMIFKELKPDIVFHAAAYKHVPLMEDNPHEAVRVNIGGTRLISALSEKYGVQKFVLVSSDKSVNPTNVMGASKRICELVIQSHSKQGSKTQFVITRFGNVLGSNGSVIPLFEKQIKEGGPVTVTHPEITRFFMTIPEACELVLEAGFMGKDDQIYVFDMGNPVPIVDLAFQMIRLSGLVPEKDIQIIFTGLRPGEKLYEEILSEGENTLPTHHPKIKIAQVENNNEQGRIEKIDMLIENVYNYSKQEVVSIMQDLVPEFKCVNSIYSES